MARDAVTRPLRADPVSRILVSVTGLAVMVVALIWATSRSSPATWFIATLSGLIALGGIALLDLAGWGRVVIRAVALADIILGVITAFTVGVSLFFAAAILLWSTRGSERVARTTPILESTRVDARSRRLVWASCLSVMVLILAAAIRLRTEGTVGGQGKPSVGSLIGLGVLGAIGGLALVEPIGWGRFVARAVGIAAVALIFAGLWILSLPLIVVAAILILSSRGPRRS